MAITILRPGEKTPLTTRPGDYLLIHGQAALSWLIEIGQHIHHPHAAARWTHAACPHGNTLTEAQANGIHQAPINKYDNRLRALITHDIPTHLRDQADAYLHSVEGQEYGYLDFASVTLAALFGTRLIITTGRSMICSQLVAQMLERCDLFVPGPPELVTPAALYEFAL